MDTETYDQMRQALGDDLLPKLHVGIDDSVPTGVVEQRAPGQPTVRMSAASFVRRVRAEQAPPLATIRARRKRERQNRVRGRR